MTSSSSAARSFGRDFWFFYAGQSISNLGSAFTRLALPLLVFQLTHSADSLALSLVSGTIPYLLFALPIGAVLDRVNRKRAMILADLGRVAALAAVPVAATTHHLDLVVVLAVNIVQATLTIAFTTGQFAVVPALVPAESIAAANGRLQSTYSVAQVAGLLLAGILVTAISVADLYIADAASFAISAVSLQLVRSNFAHSKAQTADTVSLIAPRRMLTDVRAGVRYAWDDPLLRIFAAVTVSVNLFAANAITQLVLFAHQRLGASDAQTSLLYAAGAAGAVALAPLAGPLARKWRPGRVGLACLFVEGLGTVAFAVNHNYPAALAIWAATSGITILYNVNLDTLRQQTIPHELLGRFMSIVLLLAYGAATIGALIGAAVVDTAGIATTYILSGALTTAAAAVFCLTRIASTAPTASTDPEDVPLVVEFGVATSECNPTLWV